MLTYRNLGRFGRFGNQLFQLAASFGIAMTTSQELVLPDGWRYRKYLSIPDDLFGPIPAEARESYEVINGYDPRAVTYLQDWSLFEPWLPTLRKWLQPSDFAWEMLANYHLPSISTGPRLAIHVRRGDNVFDPGVPNKSDYHICPPLEYYDRAIKMHYEGVESDGPLPVPCMFGDDIPWCRANFPEAAFYGDSTVMPKESEPEYETTEPMDWIDLFLMSTCQRFVITGSTFGIWAAILADVPPEHVVRPDRVFGPIVAAYTDSEKMFDPRWRVCPVAS